MRQTISAVIIAKNEEEMIGDCLRSVAFCDEILVIDGGSGDKTVAIAKKYGARVIIFPSDDFSRSRNKAIELTTSDWILYVDADERVSKQLMLSIKAAIATGGGVRAYPLQRKNVYFRYYPWPKIEHLERLFLKKSLRTWRGQLHESAIFEGDTGELGGFLLHYSHRDLSSMLEKTLTWSSIEARNRFDTKHPLMTWWRFPRVMLTAFIDSYIKQSGWKVGTPGLIESVYQAYSAFVTYAKLWEMQLERAPHAKALDNV